MVFKLNIKYVQGVKDNGRWVKITLKNGLILEDKTPNFTFERPFFIHN